MESATTIWTLIDPADFGDWGGDDSGLTGQVWEEWTNGYESRRCELWAGVWLFSRGPFPSFGVGDPMTEEIVARFQAMGIPIQSVDRADFERAWTTALSRGTPVDYQGDSKIRAVFGDGRA